MRIFQALIAILLWGISVSAASAQAHQHPLGPEQCPIGDYLCGHGVYHEIYRLLELISERTCCNDSEGRPTKDAIDATPEQKMRGYRFQAWVDGMWCPVKAESLLRFSPKQKEQLKKYKNSELMLRFLESSHVFSPKAITDVSGKKECPTVYCFWAKGPSG